MTKRRKITLLIALLGLAVAYLLWPPLLRYAVLKQLHAAQLQGARISWEGLNAAGLRVSVDSFEGWIAGPAVRGGLRPPLQIKAGQTEVRLEATSLLWLSPTLTFSAQLYGGSVEGRVTDILSTPHLWVRCTQIDLASHPQLRAFGVTGANLSAHVENGVLAPGAFTADRFLVELSQVAVANLPSRLGFATLPQLQNAQLTVRGRSAPTQLELQEVTVAAPYGAVRRGEALVEISNGTPTAASGSFDLTIAAETHRQLAQLLPALSNNVLTPATRSFTARLSGVDCTSRPRVLGDVALGALCLRFVPENPQPG